MPVLQSQWGTLHPSLLARLYPVTRRSTGGSAADYVWERAPASQGGDIEVAFPISDSTLDANLNWTSPFEAIGAENKLPIISALIQSGALASVTSTLIGLLPSEIGGIETGVETLADDAKKLVANLEGRTGITKLNSTQIFSGMNPLDFPLTAYFRAWQDARSEVEDPINQLMSWALPAELSKAGIVETFARDRDPIRALFPSRVPSILGIEYAGSTILPVVIESISQPITAPRNRSGARISVAIPMKMATLAALDRDEYRSYKIR
ncbi:hypothetical protein [Nevskia ramosa]|uniref:hypothetical protein n=1 Tax=Nevskia ramosa TaxID=64002 RepID=UPI003D12A2A8